jgi:hypothetical protein
MQSVVTLTEDQYGNYVIQVMFPGPFLMCWVMTSISPVSIKIDALYQIILLSQQASMSIYYPLQLYLLCLWTNLTASGF